MQGSATAQWITAGALLAALLGAAIAILDNRRTARRRLTYEYIARLEDPGLIKHQALITSLLLGALRPPSISKKAWAAMDRDRRRDAARTMWRQLAKSNSVQDRR